MSDFVAYKMIASAGEASSPHSYVVVLTEASSLFWERRGKFYQKFHLLLRTVAHAKTGRQCKATHFQCTLYCIFGSLKKNTSFLKLLDKVICEMKILANTKCTQRALEILWRSFWSSLLKPQSSIHPALYHGRKKTFWMTRGGHRDCCSWHFYSFLLHFINDYN